MKWLGGGAVLLLLGALGVPCPARAESAAAPAEWLDVRAVSVEPIDGGRRVTIALTRAPDAVRERPGKDASRLVVDLEGPRPKTPVAATPYPLQDDVVSQVRVGTYGGKLRAVIELSRAVAEHAVHLDGTTVIAELRDAPTPAPAGPAAAAAPAAADDGPLTVRDVTVTPTPDGRRLVVELNRAPDGIKEFALDGPPRLVIDARGPLPDGPVNTRFPLDDAVVSRVRIGQNGGALRVVADLRGPVSRHTVRQDGNRLVAELTGTPEAAAEKPTPRAAAEAPAVPPAAARAGRAATSDDGHMVLAAAVVADAPTRVATPDPVVAEPPPAKMPAPATPIAAEPAPEQVVRVSTTREPDTSHVADSPFRGQRISLDFKDADIHNVLRVLADVSSLNIIATDDVKGKITLHLNEVPWDQALDLVLRANRLEKSHEGNVVRISTVSRLKEEREALRAAQDAEHELEPVRVKYVRVNYARADEALIEKVKGVLTDRGGVTFDDRTNTVIVRDIPKGIEDASYLIRELDVQSPQVLIEANIVEATEDFARGLGVQWGYVYNGGPQTGTPTGSNFPGTVGVGGTGLGSGAASPASGAGVARPPVPFLADFPVPSNFAGGFGAGSGSALNLALGSLDGAHTLTSRLTALEEAGKGKVISRPRVITMNNVAATIQSLTILRVKLPSTGTVINTGTGGAAGSASTATEKINTGITLVVTPQVSADGFVLMNIYAKSSQPDFTRQVDGIPSEVSREANSNVLIKDGETVVLGGIFRNVSDDRETGIPYLRDVPGLGWLFKRMLKTNRREELLVFLTPKILNGTTASLPGAERLWERRPGG
jgi:type IV pilus assembly protein PilQ